MTLPIHQNSTREAPLQLVPYKAAARVRTLQLGTGRSVHTCYIVAATGAAILQVLRCCTPGAGTAASNSTMQELELTAIQEIPFAQNVADFVLLPAQQHGISDEQPSSHLSSDEQASAACCRQHDSMLVAVKGSNNLRWYPLANSNAPRANDFKTSASSLLNVAVRTVPGQSKC